MFRLKCVFSLLQASRARHDNMAKIGCENFSTRQRLSTNMHDDELAVIENGDSRSEIRCPSLKNIFFFMFLQLNVWASLYTMMYVQSLTLKESFYIHLVESGKFVWAHWNAIFRGGPTSMICDLTNSPKFNCVMGKLNASLSLLSSSSI